MAIKLSKEGKVTKIAPHFKKHFDIDSMENVVGGWPDPVKIGPIWVIRNENAEKSLDNMNNVASRFFQAPIYGDILVVSSLELPPDWDLVEESDKQYTSDEIDAGFVKSLTEMTMFENFYLPIAEHHEPEFYDNVSGRFAQQPEIYTYTPDKQTVMDDNFKDFLRNAYDYVISSGPDYKNFIIYRDEFNLVKVVEKKDRLKTIDQMLEILVEDEAYEKAAKLRDIRPIVDRAV